MSIPHVSLVLVTLDQLSPEFLVRCTPPPDQFVPNTTELRSREQASPGISEPTAVYWSVKIPVLPVVRQYLPNPLLVIPSLTMMSELSLSGTTTMSHGLRNSVCPYLLQVLPRSIERNSESVSTPRYIVSGRSGSTSSGIPYSPKSCFAVSCQLTPRSSVHTMRSGIPTAATQ